MLLPAMTIPTGPRPDSPEGPVVGHLEQAVLEILTPVEVVDAPSGLVYKPGLDDFANAALLIREASEAGRGLLWIAQAEVGVDATPDERIGAYAEVARTIDEKKGRLIELAADKLCAALDELDELDEGAFPNHKEKPC